jgi:hypothetical protein
MRVRLLSAAVAVVCLVGSSLPARAQPTGSVVGWGSRILPPPNELTDLTAISAGFEHRTGP